MDITPALTTEKQRIGSYGGGGFTIGGTRHDYPVLVLPEKTFPWDARAHDALTVEQFSPLLKLEPRPELCLVGTGREFLPLPSDVLQALRAEGIVMESMDTGAACRTFNVLLAEERRIAAALLPV